MLVETVAVPVPGAGSRNAPNWVSAFMNPSPPVPVLVSHPVADALVQLPLKATLGTLAQGEAACAGAAPATAIVGTVQAAAFATVRRRGRTVVGVADSCGTIA